MYSIRQYGLVLASASLLAACGGAGGACDPSCNGPKVGCHEVGSQLTALQALAAAEGPAMSSLGAASRWVGAIEGLKITHDGTPSQVPDATFAGVNLYTGGWVFKYCAGMNEVVYGAGPQTSSAGKGCGTIDCSQVPTNALPVIDSPAVIATAFPSDPATATYKLDLNVLPGMTRTWTVQPQSGATVKVDADTGAVVP